MADAIPSSFIIEGLDVGVGHFKWPLNSLAGPTLITLQLPPTML